MSKQSKIQVLHPEAGYKRAFFFTDHRIERNGNHHLFQVGFVHNGMLVDHLSFHIDSVSLARCSPSLLELADKVGLPDQSTRSDWRGILPLLLPESVDTIFVALGDQNEILLGRVSSAALSEKQRRGSLKNKEWSQPRLRTQRDGSFEISLFSTPGVVRTSMPDYRRRSPLAARAGLRLTLCHEQRICPDLRPRPCRAPATRRGPLGLPCAGGRESPRARCASGGIAPPQGTLPAASPIGPLVGAV